MYLHPLAVIFCALLLAPDATAAPDPSTVDSIIEKYVKAMGGKAALEKITSRTLVGKLEHPMIPGGGAEWHFFAKAPDKQLVQVDIPSWGSSEDGFDGQVAWGRNPAGLRVKNGEELDKAKRDAQFARELNFKKIFPKLTYKGTSKVGDEEAEVLESIASPSNKETFFFSKKSGLLIRQDSEFSTGQGNVVSKAVMGDYRASDGVQFAYAIKGTLSSAGQETEFTLKITDLKNNLKIEDSKFLKPAK
jgi:zinc protease